MRTRRIPCGPLLSSPLISPPPLPRLYLFFPMYPYIPVHIHIYILLQVRQAIFTFLHFYKKFHIVVFLVAYNTAAVRGLPQWLGSFVQLPLRPVTVTVYPPPSDSSLRVCIPRPRRWTRMTPFLNFFFFHFKFSHPLALFNNNLYIIMIVSKLVFFFFINGCPNFYS